MSMSTLYLHEVVNVTLSPVRALTISDSFARDLKVTDQHGTVLTVTMFTDKLGNLLLTSEKKTATV